MIFVREEASSRCSRKFVAYWWFAKSTTVFPLLHFQINDSFFANRRIHELPMILVMLVGEQRHGSILVVDRRHAVQTSRRLIVTTTSRRNHVVLPLRVRHDQHAVRLICLGLLEREDVRGHAEHEVEVVVVELLQRRPLHYAFTSHTSRYAARSVRRS